ncbi:MAG: CpaF family protein [Planctomycetota bacterium]
MSEREEKDLRQRIRSGFSRSKSNETAARFSQKRLEKAAKAVGDRTRSVAGALRSRKADYLSIKAELQERLLEEIGDRQVLALGDDAVAKAVDDFVTRILASEELPLNEAERTRLADELKEETLGVGPLAGLMVDPAVTDILVNGPDKVFIERFGRLERTSVRFRDDQHVIRVIERIAARLGRRIDTSSPMLDARLPDGSRVNATIPPISIDGPTMSIRRFGRHRLRREDLIRGEMLSLDMAEFFDCIVRARKNILIAGGTGAGKSTLLGALAESIPNDERIITIEDTAELILDQEHVVRLETRPANIEGRGQVGARELVVNSLRMRPDRIIVGEVRSAEALDMLQALNTGHDGGMCTIHANSPRDALSRLETMVLMAGLELPSRAIREQIVSAVDFIVHVRRFEDGVRRIETVTEMAGLEGNTPLLQDIFKFERRGGNIRRVVGEYQATGVVPRVVQELRSRDLELRINMFQK